MTQTSPSSAHAVAPRTAQVPTDEATIASMFDRVAPRYDMLNRLLSMRQDQRWRKALVASIPPQQSGLLLDVATGTGDVLFAVAKQRPDFTRFIGADVSGAMLEFARKKEAQNAESFSENRTVSFLKMSAEKLDFATDSMDAVTISFGFRNVVGKLKALSEFHRVLRPGGTLHILEFFTPQNTAIAHAFDAYFHHILPKIGGLLSDKTAYTYLPQSVAGFYTPSEMRQALVISGFKIKEEKDFLFGATRLVVAEKSALN